MSQNSTLNEVSDPIGQRDLPEVGGEIRCQIGVQDQAQGKRASVAIREALCDISALSLSPAPNGVIDVD